MNRRGFLGKMLAGAAVVIGAGAVPKVAEAAEKPISAVSGTRASDLWFSDSAIEHGDGPSGWYMEDDGAKHYLVDGIHQRECCPPAPSALDLEMALADRGYATWDSFRIANNTISGTRSSGIGYYIAPGTYIRTDSTALPAGTTIRGAGIEQTTTFEAMQAGCAARGCRLEDWISGDGRTIPTHISERIEGWGNGHRSALTPTGLAAVDAWRRSLHESGG